MKHLMAFFVLLISCFSYAQERYTKHDFFFSYGVSPVINERFDMPEDYATGTTLQTEDSKKWGSINIGYLYSISKKIAVGASYTYSSMKANLRLPNAVLNRAKRKDTYHIAMPNFQYRWFAWNSFTFYSKAGMGIAFGKCDITVLDDFFQEDSMEERKFFVWQASPLGIEWGGKYAAAFIEGGIGAMGCVQAGVKIKL